MKLEACQDRPTEGIAMGTLRLAAALVAVSLGCAAAQSYPSRAITIVVPFPPGGPSDTVARILAEHMRGTLGRPLIIENVGGAGGSIGVGRVARAAPDGYTLSIGNWGTHVANGAIYPLHYDLVRDFEPVALLGSNPQVIVASNTVPAKNLRELIAWLNANPDKATMAIGGIGTPSHISSVYFENRIRTRFQIVPYRGGGTTMQDLIAGHVDMMIEQSSNVVAQVRAGGIRAFAVTSKSRLTAAPDIPTTDEAGLPDFYMSVWFGLWAPRGTPNGAIARLNSAVVAALADPVVRDRLAKLGLEISPLEQQTPEALGAYQKAEIEKWWPIIKAAGIKVE
jgi:tripartite-type tricarboxylate transporter receptor subunit TctC